LITGSLWHPALERIYRTRFGEGISSCGVLSSHGSDRIILRLLSSTASAIGIINKDLRENRAFIEFSNHFRKFNLRVPEIYGTAEDGECYLTEDLGDITLFNVINSRGFTDSTVSLYKTALGELVRFQAEAGPSLDYTLCYQFDEFGEENIEYDLSYFREKFLDNYYTPARYNEQRLNECFGYLKRRLLECPREYFLYRDFQSRNIMLRDGIPHFIDYQSGRRGALQYDLASLLYDSRANMPQDIRESLIDYYIHRIRSAVKLDAEEFKNYFWYFAVIRILQALGAYAYLGLRRGKTKFLESIPYAIRNISVILDQKLKDKELEYLREILSEWLLLKNRLKVDKNKASKEHEREKNQRA